MKICVKDLSGTGSKHDPLSVSYVVIGGWYQNSFFPYFLKSLKFRLVYSNRKFLVVSSLHDAASNSVQLFWGYW